MQTDPITPILTRRLRVAFDVEVSIPPFPDENLEVAPDMVFFHQALLNNPDLLDRMITRKALHHLYEHMAGMYVGDDGTGWFPKKFFNITASAVRQMTVDQALYFLEDELLNNSDTFQYWALWVLLETNQTNCLPLVTDLDTGKSLSWEAVPPVSLLHRSIDNKYLLVQIRDENVLVLNLMDYPSTWEIIENLAITAGELDGLGLEVQRLLIIFGRNKLELSLNVHDAILAHCDEAFPGLPVEMPIKIKGGEDEGSEAEKCETSSC